MRAQAPSGGNMSKKSRRIIVSVVSLIVVAAIVVVGLKVLAARKTAAAFAARRAGVSSMYVVAPQDVATLTTVSGTVDPLRYATLTAQAQGAITAVYKKEGDLVKKGEIIVRIDSTSQDNQLAQAESKYRQAVITFETTQMTSIADLKTKKEELESAVSNALANQLSAEVNLQNSKDTSDQTITSLQQAVKTAQIGLINAQNSLKSLQQDPDTSAQQQTLSDLSVTQAQQNLSSAEAKLVTLTTAVPATLQTAIDAQLASIDAARLSLQNAQVQNQDC